MATTAISNQYYDRVIKSTKIFLLIIAGIALFILASTAVHSKFENLKSKIEQGQINPPITMAERERQLDCLTKNIYWEAAAEPFEGKVAVAQVTMNRVQSGKFADNVCGVVYQKNSIYQKVICQFSWVCEGKKTLNKDSENYRESLQVAYDVLAYDSYRNIIPSTTLFFHNLMVNPMWPYKQVAKIGNHVFYEKHRPHKHRNLQVASK